MKFEGPIFIYRGFVPGYGSTIRAIGKKINLSVHLKKKTCPWKFFFNQNFVTVYNQYPNNIKIFMYYFLGALGSFNYEVLL